MFFFCRSFSAYRIPNVFDRLAGSIALFQHRRSIAWSICGICFSTLHMHLEGFFRKKQQSCWWMPSITLLWPRCLLLCGWNFLIRIWLQCYLMNQKICNDIWCPTVYQISSDVLLESISCFCSILLMRCRSARSPCGQGICCYTGGPHVT